MYTNSVPQIQPQYFYLTQPVTPQPQVVLPPPVEYYTPPVIYPSTRPISTNRHAYSNNTGVECDCHGSGVNKVRQRDQVSHTRTRSTRRKPYNESVGPPVRGFDSTRGGNKQFGMDYDAYRQERNKKLKELQYGSGVPLCGECRTPMCECCGKLLDRQELHHSFGKDYFGDESYTLPPEDTRVRSRGLSQSHTPTRRHTATHTRTRGISNPIVEDVGGVQYVNGRPWTIPYPQKEKKSNLFCCS
eukprot:GHVR01012955.1.p1 GENE.GHVR01012955.1~~GHVR01012955.1.p1  ORF type:complete len:244 (-),score=61.93 GHVR01012955.1:279-1010(-)